MQVHDPDQLQRSFNVNVIGDGPVTLVLVHGFGCNQAMWHHLVAELAGQYRLVLMDLMGCGLSDPSGYCTQRYASLDAHVEDVLGVAEAFAGDGSTVLVGHSVGASVCVEASLRAPDTLAAQVLVSPSPCFINDGDYRGGFERDHLHDIVRVVSEDRAGWAESFADLVVGAGRRDGFAQAFVQSVCAMHEPALDPLLRQAFLVDQRAMLPRVRTPTLILQASDDALAPPAVGEYMHQAIRHSQLRVVRNTGHSPHLTAARDCAVHLREFLGQLGHL